MPGRQSLSGLANRAEPHHPIFDAMEAGTIHSPILEIRPDDTQPQEPADGTTDRLRIGGVAHLDIHGDRHIHTAHDPRDSRQRIIRRKRLAIRTALGGEDRPAAGRSGFRAG